ncbi:MAG: hypothetical protein EOO69_03140 [Moraxellaceae bacterium]|nr:MAG: hypothetical protein EOO69_03140 [Moraxellaceae bacterium]
MINNFEKIISKLHDARLFGFLLDSNPNSMEVKFILYVQLFSDYDCELYSLEKALLIFETPSVTKLSINDDLFNGQFFITDILIQQLEDRKFTFNFIFNDSSIELVIIAENMNLISSGIVEENNIQFLSTNWRGLLD